jgi:hypothetical protein
MLSGLMVALAVSHAGLVLAKGATVDAATPEQSTEASDKYRAGTAAFEAGRYDEALGHFEKSYDVVASPNSHLMIARTLSKMNKNAEAFAAIESTIAEADLAASKSDKYKKTAQMARAERDEMTKKVGFVVVSLPSTVTVGSETIKSPDLGRVVVSPGKNEVVLRLPTGEETRRTVEVAAGDVKRVDLALPAPSAAAPAPAPAECPPARTVHTSSGIDQRTLAYVAGGVGVAGFATFAVFGILNNGKYQDLEAQCPGGICPPGASSDAETGRTYQTLANVGLGVGIVGLATGTILFLTAPSRKTETVSLKPTTRLAVGPASVSFQGKF